MSKIFGDIKSQLQGVLKIKDVNSDNFVFKLFYKATFALLIGAAGNFWLLRYTLGFHQVWYEGIACVKSTVCGVFQDLKLKISKGSDQN